MDFLFRGTCIQMVSIFLDYMAQFMELVHTLALSLKKYLSCCFLFKSFGFFKLYYMNESDQISFISDFTMKIYPEDPVFYSTNTP